MKNRLILAAVMALTSLGGQAARAGIVFDSITGSTAVGELAIAPTTGPLGDSFLTGATASSLSDVKFDFYNPSSSTTGSVTIALYSNSSGNAPVLGSPLEVLGSVATSAISPGTFQVVDFSSFTPINLSSTTRYWILVSTSNGSPLEAVITSNLLGTGVALEFNYFSGTAQTNASVGGTFEMQVTTGPSLVPEPSSLVLCGIAGLGGLCYYARRRRASSAS